jgi:flagellar biosynthetic protein FlhB
LALTIFKIFVVVLISFLNIRSKIPQLANTINMTLLQASTMLLGLAFRIVMEATLFFLLLSIPDFLFQRWQHRESLKMTTHEIKEEYKESEGDPQVKAKLKQRMREILQANMMQNVPKAAVVITNPTHYAIALEYRYGEMVAPRVIAKGVDHMAQRIKEIARDNRVPQVENRPLARALYANVDIGDLVPEDYWQIVADILKGIESIRMEAGA